MLPLDVLHYALFTADVVPSAVVYVDGYEDGPRPFAYVRFTRRVLDADVPCEIAIQSSCAMATVININIRVETAHPHVRRTNLLGGPPFTQMTWARSRQRIAWRPGETVQTIGATYAVTEYTLDWLQFSTFVWQLVRHIDMLVVGTSEPVALREGYGGGKAPDQRWEIIDHLVERYERQ